MNRFKCVLCLILSLVAPHVLAADIPVTDSLVFSVDIADGWTLHIDDPPEALIMETASHIAHEPAAANATQEQINRVARNRLMANEAIVYHAKTGAHLDIDFSPLEEGEKEPASRDIKNSAKYAAESLSSEEDIEDVVSEIAEAKIAGAEKTYLLTANYLQHGKPMTFQGYIGFVADSWFFLYFTAPGQDPASLDDMTEMIKNASVKRLDR